MKINKQAVIESFKELTTKTPSKFWGFISICNAIETKNELKSGVTYRVSTSKISEKLQDLFWFDQHKKFNDSEVFIRFSQVWIEQVSEQLLKDKVRLLDIAIFFFRNHDFDIGITQEILITKLLDTLKITTSEANKIFDLKYQEKEISLENYSN